MHGLNPVPSRPDARTFHNAGLGGRRVWGFMRQICTEERTMREIQRKQARRKLDVEMRPYRRAAAERHPTGELLRAVRQALRVPVAEIGTKMGVNRSVVYGLERSERNKSITLRSLGRMAQAMGCKVVYGIVPLGGKTLEELVEERLWRSVLGAGDEELGTRD
jgi:transcriptional regulator with XRE-family HTH domain